MAFVGTVWGGAAQSYGSLMGARVVQGLGTAMWESGEPSNLLMWCKMSNPSSHVLNHRRFVSCS